MKSLNSIVICTVLILLMSCGNESRKNEFLFDDQLGVNQTFNLDFLGEISPELYETLLKDTRKIVILFFEGSCSACILEFLKFLNTVTIVNQVTYLYIASTNNDLLLLEHHIEQSGRQLGTNEYLLPDTSSAFYRYNPTIVTQLLPLLFIENNSTILSAISLYSYKKGTYPFDK